MPGVEVLATGIAQLTGGDGLVRDTDRSQDRRRGNAPVTIGAALSSCWCPSTRASHWSLRPWACGLGDSLVVRARLLAERRPATCRGLSIRRRRDRPATNSWIGGTPVRYWRAPRQRSRQFQSPVLADRIARNPDFLREPVKQTAVILFVDLSGFTRAQRTAWPFADAGASDAVSHTGGEQGGCAWRIGDELHGRRRDDCVRRFRLASGRRLARV